MVFFYFMRAAVNAAIIDYGKLLLVKKKDVWILPGGKPEKGEDDFQCLEREVSEELSGTILENFVYYGEFTGKTPHKGDFLTARVYFADIKGTLYNPSSEISDYAWAENPIAFNLSDITYKIVSSLVNDGFISVNSK